jgi:pantothenate kinase type III
MSEIEKNEAPIPTTADPAPLLGNQEAQALPDSPQDVGATSTAGDKQIASDETAENTETPKDTDVEIEDGVFLQHNGAEATTAAVDAAALSSTESLGIKSVEGSEGASGEAPSKIDEEEKRNDPMIEDEAPPKRGVEAKAEDLIVEDNPVKDESAEEPQKVHLISNEDSTGQEVSWRDTKALSISAGNTHIQWAFHSAPKEGYAPILFWRTPHLPDREGGRNKDSQVLNDFLEITKDPARATETLTRHLPDNVQAYIFGDPVEESSDLKKLPNVKIYVVSTSPHQLDALEKVWNKANCQCEFEVMTGDQFFTLEDGAYKTMGADRLATLKGAIDLYGLPALVVDGGTAMTYTAADSSGRVMGGGISPGLKLRMESLHNCTAALPYISPEEAYYRVMGEISGSKDSPANVALLAKSSHPLPMDLFACTTEDAMLVSSFGDVGTWLRRCIGGWLHVVGTGKGKKGGRAKKKSQDAMDVLTTGKKTNNDRYVLFTGGDAEILMRMTGKSGEVIRVGSANRKVINKGAGKLDSVVVTADVETLEQCQLVSRNNLVHYGVSRVLKDEYYKKFAKSDKESKLGGLDIENLHSMIGTRVAKRFAALNTDGTHFFRGVVNEIYPDDGGDLLFGVTYDDGDREHLNLEELHRKETNSLVLLTLFMFRMFNLIALSLKCRISEAYPRSWRTRAEAQTRIYVTEETPQEPREGCNAHEESPDKIAGREG